MPFKPQLQDEALLIGKNFINGHWVDSVSDKTFNVTGEFIYAFFPLLLRANRESCLAPHSQYSSAADHRSDPATGELIGSCPESVSEDAERAILSAATALPAWRSRSGRDRARILRRWYDLIMENKADLATLITWENGKAKADAAGEVVFAASFLEWFAEEAARIYGDVIPHSNPNMRVSVLKEPVGVCGLITP